MKLFSRRRSRAGRDRTHGNARAMKKSFLAGPVKTIRASYRGGRRAS
jgi:hypothetical protein